MKIPYFLICATLLTAAVGTFTACNKEQGGSQEANKQPAIDLTALDTTVRPQEDFYRFANGGWIKNNPLKPEYSRYGSFDILRDSAQSQVRQIIETIASTKQKAGTNEYRIATLYKQAMDSVKRNELGAQPIQPTLKEIEKITQKEDLVRFLAKQDNLGENILFDTYVFADQANSTTNIMNLSQTSLPLGNRDYYLAQDPESAKILEAYKQYIQTLAKLSGYTDTQAERIANNQLAISKQIAKFSYSQEQLRDSKLNYNKLQVASFVEEHAAFPWELYLKERDLAQLTEWNVGQTAFFDQFATWYKDVNLDQIKDFLLASIMDRSATVLSDDFAKANFEFYGRTLSGRKEQQPRWKTAVALVEGFVGEAVGEEYVKKYFPPEAKEKMIGLIDNLKLALKDRILGLAWMSAETKEKAVEKLSSFTVKVGYPDKWKDYSKMEIDANKTFYENCMSAQLFEHKRNMAELGQEVDRTRWYMNPQTVNAYYMPTTNEICFPAGILQPPFFNLYADDAVNYGAIGVVIGHEMTHGFDDQGRNYDKDGNLNNWWTDKDSELFTAETQKLVKQFDGIEILPGLFANGTYTLGENIADQGGVLVAYLALQKALNGKEPATIDGYTAAQRFFIAYARLWGQNITEETVRLFTKVDVHSLGEYRVNQTLKNIDAFYEAFNVQPSDAMYLAPEKRVVIW